MSKHKLMLSLTIFPIYFQTDTGKKASTLVAHGATHALFTVLVYESREETPNEELLVSIHQVLAKLAPKGKTLLL